LHNNLPEKKFTSSAKSHWKSHAEIVWLLSRSKFHSSEFYLSVAVDIDSIT